MNMKLQPFYKVQSNDWLLINHELVKQDLEKIYNDKMADKHDSIAYARQWIIHELTKSYNYPLEWLNDRIGFNEDEYLNKTFKNSCLLVLKTNTGSPFIVIQIFSEGCSDAEFRRAEKEFENIISSYPSARIGCLATPVPLETKVIRRNSSANTFEYISDLPDYKSHFGNGTFYVRANTDSDEISKPKQLIPLPKRVKTIFFEIHSTIRDIDGFHDDIALDELCKVLYAKIHDENRNFYHNPLYIFQTFGSHNESEVASVIRALYDIACSVDIESHANKIPGYDRSRGVFKEPINLSDATLCKIVEKLQMFSITESDNDIKSHVFQQVLSRAIRSGMGQFFTPDEIVHIAVEVTKPKITDFILDPFCGSGHFLSRSIDYVANHYNSDDSDLLEFSLTHIHGIEKSPRMVRIAMTDMLLHNDANANIRNADALATPDNFPDITEMNNQSIKSEELAVFDLILTNPPFGKILGDENSSPLDSFQLAQKKKSIPFEIIALERCSQFLKKGGKIAIVLPDGNLANSQTQYVRDWLLANFMLKAIISLPTETFAPYGTTTKTSLCFFQKFRNDSDKDADYDIVFYKLDNIGYDATGRQITGSEVADAIEYLTTTITWD